MTTPATDSPTCPRARCGGPLVTYEVEQESPVPEGLLRCAGCGRYSEATPEQRAQAAAADAAYEAEQTRLRHEDASQRGGRGCAHSRRPC